jgi:DNA (cytosine-5)-methyltransferase 1
MMLKACDLFCKAGGAGMGIAQAGFEVTGIDIEPQPNYPFEFIQGDALTTSIEWLRGFDFIWASPPCQFATAYKRRKDHVKPSENLIPKTRALLLATGIPFVIENVAGARSELRDPVQLCGSSFGLDIRRHRLFEAHGFTIPEIPCDHAWQTPRFPCATNRKNPRSTLEIGVYRIPLATQKRGMGGCDWMTLKELSAAIPPVFAKHIASQLMPAGLH